MTGLRCIIGRTQGQKVGGLDSHIWEFAAIENYPSGLLEEMVL